MHRIGPHLPSPLPMPAALKPAVRDIEAARTLTGKKALDPFAHLAENYGQSDKVRRHNDPDRFTDRRNPPRQGRPPKPDAFSGEIEALFAAALGTPQR